MEGARRAAKRTQSREECARVGEQPNILRAGRSVGEQEGSQTHTQSRQAHSEPGGVVEGS